MADPLAIDALANLVSTVINIEEAGLQQNLTPSAARREQDSAIDALADLVVAAITNGEDSSAPRPADAGPPPPPDYQADQGVPVPGLCHHGDAHHSRRCPGRPRSFYVHSRRNLYPFPPNAIEGHQGPLGSLPMFGQSPVADFWNPNSSDAGAVGANTQEVLRKKLYDAADALHRTQSFTDRTPPIYLERLGNAFVSSLFFLLPCVLMLIRALDQLRG